MQRKVMKYMLILSLITLTSCTPIRVFIGEPTELRQQEAQLIVVETIKNLQEQARRQEKK